MQIYPQFVIYPQVGVYHEASVSNNHSKLMYKISEILRENHVAFSLRCRTGQNDWRKTGRYQTMFQLIVSCTYNFIVNDQNIGPLSLISSSPYLLLSLSDHSLTLSLSSFLLLPLSLPPSLPLSLSFYLHLSSSPSLLLSLSFSPSLLLYLSTSEQAPPVATEPAILPRELSLSVTRVTRVTGY